MRRAAPRFFRDQCTIYQPNDTQDEDRSPVQGHGLASTFACAIHRRYVMLVAANRREQHGGVEGEHDAAFFFRQDPGVLGPDWRIVVTHEWRFGELVERPEPEEFRSVDAAERDCNGTVWIIHARLTSN